MTDVRYAIYIDAQSADAELARLHKSAVSAAGSEKMLAEATTTATTALKANAVATSTAAKATETLQQRANKLPDVLGKQAAAISLVSSSLADGNGEVGKAVAGAGQMAAAYGAGGPWALALVGGLALVGQFTQYLGRLNDEQDRAIELQYANVDALSARKAALAKEVAALAAIADPKSAKKAELAAIEAEIAVAQEAAAKAKGSIYATTEEERRARLNEDKTAFDIRKAEAAQSQEIVDLLLKKYELTLKNNQATAATPPASAAAAATSDADLAEGRALIDLDAGREKRRKQQRANAEQARKEEAERAAESDAASQEIIIADRLAAEEKERAIRRASEDNDYEMREQAAQDFNNAVAGYAMQSAGIIASASTQLVADLISGQERALESFGLSIMAQAGQALVSYGTQAIGAGTLSALTGNLPMAAIQLGGGAALIGAGVGLGGVASGLGSLMGAADKKAAGSLTMSKSSERSIEGGGTSVVYIYSPTRDAAASAVAVAGRNADARGFNKTKVR